MLEAHGVGGGSDLPIPAGLAVLGGMTALVVTFVVLVWAWQRPRYDAPANDRAAPRLIAQTVDSTTVRVGLRLLGLAGLALTVWCLVAGAEEVSSNPVFGIIYVLLWVGLVPASLLFGSFIRSINPLRALLWVLTLGGRRVGSRTLPPRVGLWPAALGLLAFTWLELVSPGGLSRPTLGGWLAAYVLIVLAGALVFGDTWIERADPFEVYSTLVGHLSVWSRDASGQLMVLSPLRNLARVPQTAGLTAVTGVLLGSTTFDSFRDSTSWVRFAQSTTLPVPWVETLFLVAVCAMVAGIFVATTRTARNALAASLVPIIVGYMVAHYLTLLVETGQQTLIQLSDPLGTGADVLGIGDRQVDIWLSLHPGFLATVKVLAIVAGHLVGVIAAHDRSLTLLPGPRRTRGQIPLLIAMVVYTFTGLYLLFGV